MHYNPMEYSIQLIKEDFDRTLYNKQATHPMQSWEWGEMTRKLGSEMFRVGEFKKNKLINIFLINLQEIPFTNSKLGYLLRSVFPSREGVRFIMEECAKRNCIYLKIEPNISKNEAGMKKMLRHIDTIQEDFYVLSSSPYLYNWTIKIDLMRTEGKILASMSQKTRYNILLSQRKGVYVKEMTNSSGFTIFSRLYIETSKRKQFNPHNINYHQNIFNNLKNNIAKILIAFYKKTPIAAYELFILNEVVYYPFGGTSTLYRSYMPSNLLMWESIRFGKKLGAKTLDMWGTNSPQSDQNHPWFGFTKFKEGFGGQYSEYCGSYDLVVQKSLYRKYKFSNVTLGSDENYGLMITKKFSM